MEGWAGCPPLGRGMKGTDSKIARGGLPAHDTTVTMSPFPRGVGAGERVSPAGPGCAPFAWGFSSAPHTTTAGGCTDCGQREHTKPWDLGCVRRRHAVRTTHLLSGNCWCSGERGDGGFGMTPWCDDLVCSWRRLLAEMGGGRMRGGSRRARAYPVWTWGPAQGAPSCADTIPNGPYSARPRQPQELSVCHRWCRASRRRTRRSSVGVGPRLCRGLWVPSGGWGTAIASHGLLRSLSCEGAGGNTVLHSTTES